MRVFVTGASGFIGSAVIPELISAGHRVIGLARSEASAAKVAALGAEVQRGELSDLESLRAATAKSDGVVHLGFIHDFSNFEASCRTDLQAVEAMGKVLEGTNKPFVTASGVLGVALGRLATEKDDPPDNLSPRTAGVKAALGFAARGVRTSAVRFAPTVHGKGDHGFMATLVGIAREKGVAGYIGDGASRWPAVHRLDAAKLVRLTMEKAPAGYSPHAVAEEGITQRSIAELIGKQLKLPVKSIAANDAAAHFGWMARFLAFDSPASSAATQALLGWKPAHPGLLEDLAAYYF
jgi:nucleoside-diphosphate-sugar epimerase